MMIHLNSKFPAAQSHKQIGILSELWNARHIFFALVWRNITTRYKQAILGIAWSVIRPLSIIIIFTFVFGVLIKPTLQPVPYFLLVATALIPWNFFATAISDASVSLTSNRHIISKIYVPRILFPLAIITTNALDFIIGILFVFILVTLSGIQPTIRLLLLPLLIVLLFIFTTAAGLLLATLQAKYRDITHLLPIMLQVGILASPIGYSSAIVPQQLQPLFFANPITILIEGFRWSLLPLTIHINVLSLITSIFTVSLLCIIAVYSFNKIEKTLADYL